MGDASAEPSMEDILSSIKRIIAEEGEGTTRMRRPSIRPVPSVVPPPPSEEADEVLELRHSMSTESTSIDPPAPQVEPQPQPKLAPAPETIVSQETAQATRGALDALSRLLVKPEPNTDGTLEGLVREMLRPMLSEWLDANLPAIVESVVAREIAKITNSGR